MYLQDMLEFCDAVIAYAGGQSFEAWSADGMQRDATLHRLALIGEAAMRIPDDVRLEVAAIP